MNDEIAIKVEGLGKRYVLGARRTGGFRYQRFSDSLVSALRAPFRRGADEGSGGGEGEAFWALEDVSFEVKAGEVLGIVGRNGAGKSTLLKVLSRISEPTRGRIELAGRVAALLEVGTGFHPELTGRENIQLNGAILGMTRAEIRRKFDEIVAFAEVEQFLDTPVKRYSSGMYVRLAFAVAAHLEPDILVVDEVLAVGDAAFQKKCLGKMREVAATGGRTVLFVSHNMHAVRELCTRALLLEKGRKTLEGAPRDVIAAYLARDDAQADIRLDGCVRQGPREFVKLLRLELRDAQGQPTTTFVMNEPLVARIELECRRRMTGAEVGLKISSHFGAAIHYFTSSWEGLLVDLAPGRHVFEVRVPQVWLLPGIYVVGLWAARDGEGADEHIQDITELTVVKGDVTGYRTRMEQYAYSGCEVYSPSRWRVVEGPEAKA